MSEGADRPRKVQLETAVQMIVDHIAHSMADGGLQTGTVSLDLQVCLVEQEGKLVPVVPIESIEEGSPIHRLRFDLGLDPSEIGRPDTSHEGLMIMDHPPPRESQEVTVTISDSPKPAVEGKSQPPPPPPPQPQAHKVQEVAVTLSDRSRPVVEERIDRPHRAKPNLEEKAPKPSKPERADQTPEVDGEDEREPSLTKRESIKETMHDMESKFAMLDQVSTPIEDDDDFEQAEETTVTDTFPVEEGPKPKERKGPKIVLPSNPRLKLRKASDAAAMRSKGKKAVERDDEPPAPRADIDFKPPQPDEVAVKDSTDEVAVPLKVSQTFIVFDHQKARRRPDKGGDDALEKGSEPPSGRAGAEG